MKKYLSIFLAALMVATMMAGCGGGNGGSSAPAPSTPAGDGGSTSAPAPEGTKVWKVANIVNGNLGDKSFFDSCEAGLKKLQDDGLITYKTFELGRLPQRMRPEVPRPEVLHLRRRGRPAQRGQHHL